MNRQVAFLDDTVPTKYVFPFWDRTWTVRLILMALFGGTGPRVFAGPLNGVEGGLVAARTAKDARPLAEVPPSSFHGMFHFDPWWVFRGGIGLGLEYRDAIVRTNIAHPLRVGGTTWKIRDVEFGPRVESVDAIEAEDDRFRKTRFTKATLDLDSHSASRPGGVT